MFAAAALLMGWIGTTALAAHQIALQIAAILFMVPFGIAHGGDRARRPCGRARRCGAERGAPGSSAIALGVVFMAAMTLLVALTRHVIPLLFLGREAPDPQTVALAASLLVVGASFFIADGMQTIAAGACAGSTTRACRSCSRRQLLARRLHRLLAVRIYVRARRLWHLDRPVARHRRVYAVLLIARFQRLTARHYLPRCRARRMTERLTISRIGHRGDGIADTPGGPVFVPYTLPGEIVEVEPFPGHPDRRHLLRVENASPERIAPVCPHFGVCGGCQTQHWHFGRYRDWKRGLVVEALATSGARCAGRRPDRRARRRAAARRVSRAARHA